ADSNNGGPLTASVHYPGQTFYLFNNTIQLASQGATSSCASGTSWTGSSCQAPMTGTLTLSSSSCTIPSGASSCNVSVTWTTTNPVAVSGVRTDYPSQNTPL